METFMTQELSPQVTFRIDQVAERYGISKPTIYRLVKNKKFPKIRKIGSCSVWLKKDLEAFEATLEQDV